MVKKIAFIMVVFFAAMNIYAQSVLTISSGSTDLSKANAQLQLTLNLNETIDTTLYIEMPEKMTAVPIAIQNNGKNLWLKNGAKQQSRKETVLWAAAENILKFHFSQGTINSGDVVIVDLMTKYRGKQLAGDKISIRKTPASVVMAEVRLNTLKR
jgi:hypothetical protein